MQKVYKKEGKCVPMVQLIMKCKTYLLIPIRTICQFNLIFLRLFNIYLHLEHPFTHENFWKEFIIQLILSGPEKA